MNRIFSLVWNRSLRTVQVASELTSSRGGGVSGAGASSLHRHPLALACAAAMALVTLAAPSWSQACVPSATTQCGASGGDGGAGTSGGTAGAGGTGSIVSGPFANAGGVGSIGGSSNVGSAGQGYNGSGGAGGGQGVSGGAGAGGSATTNGVGGGGGGGGPFGGYAGGGGGGGGGVGQTVTGTAFGNPGSVIGGNGGNGGNGGFISSSAYGGGGGGGGAAIFATAGSTLDNASGQSFIGGNGGNGGGGYRAANGGGAGAGVVGEGFSLDSAGTILGGTGGGGGGGVSDGGYGGGGGSGGIGVSGTSLTIVNSGTITGGTGGVGSNDTAAGGAGGAGGTGVSIAASTLENVGTITGGTGGSPGTGGVGGAAGPGGIGIVATGGSTVVNSGTIAGGLSSANVQSNAISFSGGGNTLEIDGGSTITGDVVSTSGTTNGGDTLTLGGDTSSISPFDMSNVVSAVPASPTAGTTYYAGFNQFAKTGTSTWQLTGNSSVSGAWNVTSGTLEVLSGSGVGTGSVTVDNTLGQAAELKVDSGATLANHIVLNNGATLDNAGTLNDTNTSDTGAVQSSMGNASVENTGTITGAGSAIDLTDGGSVTNSGSAASITSNNTSLADVWISGNTGSVNNTDGALISGTNTGINLTNGGTVTNTGTGSTITSDGGNGVFVMGGGTVVNGSGATISGTSNGVYLVNGGTLENAGSIVGGVLMNSTAVNVVALTAGGSITGNLNIGSNTASTLTLDGTNTTPQLYSQAVTGTTTFGGALTKAGSGTWVIDSNDLSTVTGITISAGTLQVGNGGSAGSIGNGDIADGGALVFDRSDALTYSGAISGNGSLTQSGSGTLVLTGANTWTGTTTIGAGTLQIGTGGTSGSIGTGAIADNGTLVFDRSDAVALPSGLTGTGNLTQQGTGSLTVNGDDSAFAGATTVKAGSLIVGDDSHADASLGGMVTVASGATLAGMGTIGGMDLAGTLSPGGSIGTLHVTGDATFEVGSTFNVEADPNGQADQLAVAGKTMIKGGNTVVLAQPGNFAPQTIYTIITSGNGVTGTFTGVSDDQAFLTPTLAYDPNDVKLTLDRNDINFNAVATTGNEHSTATAENELGFGNPLYDALVKLNAADAQVAFNQTSGEYHASQQTARVEDSRYIREAMNQRLRNGDNDPEAAKVDGTQLTAWAHGWGHWGTVDGDGNAAKLADNGDGLLVGADLPVGTQARIGVTGGASRNTLSVNDRDSWGRETSTWLGAFAGYDAGALGLRGGIAYAWDQIPTNREVNFPGYSDRLTGNATGDTLTGFVEGSWTFHFASGTASPFLNVAHTKVETDASTEAGGAAALHAFDATDNVSFSTLGARGQINLAHHLDVHGELGWQHAFGDTKPEADLQFVAGGPAFTVYGVPIAKNAGLGRIGLGWHQGNVAVDADYEGLAGGGVKDQAAKLSVNVAF